MATKDKVREELLLAGVVAGKAPAQAARDAGFSESYARVNVYRWLAKTSTQERIRERVKEVEIDSEQALRTLDFHMRGDLADVLPENEILRKAKKNGVSGLIRKIRQRERFIPCGPGKEPIREVTTEIEIHDSQAAAKHLSSLLAGKDDDDRDRGQDNKFREGVAAIIVMIKETEGRELRDGEAAAVLRDSFERGGHDVPKELKDWTN